jgi:hypothetical protein
VGQRGELFEYSDPYTTAALAVALGLWWLGRTPTAAWIAILAVWLDQLVSVFQFGFTSMPTLLAFPPSSWGSDSCWAGGQPWPDAGIKPKVEAQVDLRRDFRTVGIAHGRQAHGSEQNGIGTAARVECWLW